MSADTCEAVNSWLTKYEVVLGDIEIDKVADVVEKLVELRKNKGRLFFIGNGGGAGHASHAAADFRKIGGIESYAWGDNVSDLTAYVNDTSWVEATESWLKDSKFCSDDALFVFSVGGGLNLGTSSNLVQACWYAKMVGGKIFGVMGKPGAIGGENHVIILDTDDTPVVEGVQAVVWHLIVSML